ncbi:hypothetical protein E2C01_100460 [Portunus trituberculatus]|uniref:Uncharacterized protein n=1 Tax=Portunus trituberculatus TaxID=210409 RepID=A0A5B7KDE3_PORTR|nr:hypothetical protein [Portunus trituberculatus]
MLTVTLHTPFHAHRLILVLIPSCSAQFASALLRLIFIPEPSEAQQGLCSRYWSLGRRRRVNATYNDTSM